MMGTIAAITNSFWVYFILKKKMKETIGYGLRIHVSLYIESEKNLVNQKIKEINFLYSERKMLKDLLCDKIKKKEE